MLIGMLLAPHVASSYYKVVLFLKVSFLPTLEHVSNPFLKRVQYTQIFPGCSLAMDMFSHSLPVVVCDDHPNFRVLIS